MNRRRSSHTDNLVNQYCHIMPSNQKEVSLCRCCRRRYIYGHGVLHLTNYHLSSKLCISYSASRVEHPSSLLPLICIISRYSHVISLLSSPVLDVVAVHTSLLTVL